MLYVIFQLIKNFDVSNILLNLKKLPLIILYKNLANRHKIRLKIFLISSLLLSFIEIFILSTLYPLIINILNKTDTSSLPKINNIIFSNLNTSSLLIVFLLAILISSIMKIWLVWFNGETSAIIGSDINSRIFKNSLYTNYEEFLTRNSSDTIANLTSISDGGFKSLFLNFQLINALLNSLGVFSGLLIINPSVAVYSLTIFGIAYFMIGKFSRKILKVNGKIIDQ